MSYYCNIIALYSKGIYGWDSQNSNTLALGSFSLINVFFGLSPEALLATCMKQLVTLSEGDANPVSASKLGEASEQPIPDLVSHALWGRRCPSGQTDQGQGPNVSVSLVTAALEWHRAVRPCTLATLEITTTWSCCKLKPDLEMILPGVHTLTAFSVQLQYLCVHIFPATVPEKQ